MAKKCHELVPSSEEQKQQKQNLHINGNMDGTTKMSQNIKF
jgi:hypothetical protein